MIDIIQVSPAKSSGKWPWIIFVAQMLNSINFFIIIPLTYSYFFTAIGVIIWIILVWFVIFKHRFFFKKSNNFSFSWRPARTWFRRSTYLNIRIGNKLNILDHGLDLITGETTIMLEKEYNCLVHSFSIDFDSWIIKPNGTERGFIYRVEFYNEVEAAMLVLQHA